MEDNRLPNEVMDIFLSDLSVWFNGYNKKIPLPGDLQKGAKNVYPPLNEWPSELIRLSKVVSRC